MGGAARAAQLAVAVNSCAEAWAADPAGGRCCLLHLPPSSALQAPAAAAGGRDSSAPAPRNPPLQALQASLSSAGRAVLGNTSAGPGACYLYLATEVVNIANACSAEEWGGSAAAVEKLAGLGVLQWLADQLVAGTGASTMGPLHSLQCWGRVPCSMELGKHAELPGLLPC